MRAHLQAMLAWLPLAIVGIAVALHTAASPCRGALIGDRAVEREFRDAPDVLRALHAQQATATAAASASAASRRVFFEPVSLRLSDGGDFVELPAGASHRTAPHRTAPCPLH